MQDQKRDMLRSIATLAWPAVLEQACQTGAQYIDTAMVGQIGVQASAAVGLTTTASWLSITPLSAIGIGVMACTSKAIGAQNPKRAGIACTQSVLLSVIAGFVIGAIAVAVSPFLPGWLGAEEEIRKDAFLYFCITSLPMVFRAAATILGAALRATGNTKGPMVITTMSILVNVVLNFLLIYPSRTFQLTEQIVVPLWGAGMGVTGAAVATGISFIFNGVFMFLLLRKNQYYQIGRREAGISRSVLKECIRVGLPVALRCIVIYLGHIFFTGMIGKLGTLAIAAHSIALTAEKAFYIPGYGMQAAAATLAGTEAGRQDTERLKLMVRLMTGISLAIMTVLSLLLFFFPAQMMSLFTPDEQVIAEGARVLRIVALSEPLFVIAVIVEGVFDGVGNVNTPFAVSVVALWLARLIPTYICVNVLNLGLESVWWCMVCDNVLRCLLLWAMFYRRDWGAYFQRSASIAE